MNPNDLFSGPALRLAQAISRDASDEVTRLINTGTDPNSVGSQKGEPGPSLLAFALLERKKKALAALLSAGAKPNLPLAKLKGASAMVFAARIPDADFMRLLLERGGDRNAKNAGGESLLQIAAFGEHWQVVELLLERGADINSAQADGETLLHQVVGRGDFAHAYYFLQHGADALQRSTSGASAARDIFHASLDHERFPKDAEWQHKCRSLLEGKGINDTGPQDELNPRPVPDWPKVTR